MRRLPVFKPRDTEVLSQHHFKYLLQAIFQNAVNQTGNPGQIAILDQLYERTEEVFESLLSYGQQLTASIVKSVIVLAIGTEKANAISIIIDEMSDLIVQAWDDSVLYDKNVSSKLFLKTRADDYLTASLSSNALNYGYRAKFISGLL
jgi:hypothetical protein